MNSVMKSILLFAISLVISINLLAQTPQGFNYQAVIRNAEGEPISEQNVNIQLTLQNQDGTVSFFVETQSITTSPQGVVNLVVGNGEVISGDFNAIPWESNNIFLKIEIDPSGGSSFNHMGTSKLLSVPFSLYSLNGTPGVDGVGISDVIDNGDGTITFYLTDETTFTTPNLIGPEGLQGPEGPQGPQGEVGPEGPLVAGTTGQTLRHDGTTWVASDNIYNSDTNVGIGTNTPAEKLEVAGNLKIQGKLIGESIEVNQPIAEDVPIFLVKNNLGQIVFAVYESGVRIYVDDTSKSTKGGFAVGGLSDQTKQTGTEYLRVTPDSVRINIKNPVSEPVKGTRGGFAVGGLSDQNKTIPSDLFFITPDSARIYLNTPSAKGTKGGFAVGGLSDQTKGSTDFLYLTPENYFIGHESGQNITDLGLYNSTLGYQTGKGLTDGSHNIFIGYQAGYLNSEGQSNVIIGNQSGYRTTSSNNAFIGYQAGFENTTGEYNTFLGYQAGKGHETNKLTGSKNVFLGHQAGLVNSSGSSNVFIGNQAGQTNTTGGNNVFLGYLAGNNNNASNNVFIGNEAGRYNSSGYINTFIGYQAGTNNSTGYWNLFLGHSAGKANTTGYMNLSIGYQAGESNQKATNQFFIGNYSGRLLTDENSYGNTFVGHGTGAQTTYSQHNTYIGYWTGYNNPTGNNNTYLGYGAGGSGSSSGNVLIGSQTGNNIGEDDNNNVIIGFGAGYFKTGAGSVIIGPNVCSNLSSYNSVSNLLMIDNFNTASPLIWGDFDGNRLVINGNDTHNPNDRTFYVNGTAGGDYAWYNDSDIKLKTDIKTIENPLSKVIKLRGVNFKWKDEREKGLKIGFIAQEAIEVLPEVVTAGETYSMQYAPITALLVEAIKEQQAIINNQQTELEALKAEIEAIKALISK